MRRPGFSCGRHTSIVRAIVRTAGGDGCSHSRRRVGAGRNVWSRIPGDLRCHRSHEAERYGRTQLGLLLGSLIVIGHNDGRTRESRRRGRLLVRREALTVNEAGRTTVPRIPIVELVSYVLDEGSLVVDSENRVCWNIHPVFWPYISERTADPPRASQTYLVQMSEARWRPKRHPLPCHGVPFGNSHHLQYAGDSPIASQ